MQDIYPHGMTARDSEDAAKLAAFQRDQEAREEEIAEELNARMGKIGEAIKTLKRSI